MKDSTKIRLHLSKALVESLTKQVIREGKSNMGGGAYTEAVKVPKGPKKMDEMSSKEKMKKGMYKENMGGEKTVQVSLDEFHAGQEWSIKLGQWAVENYPQIAKALGDTDPAALGDMIAGLATTGTIGLTLGLAAAKDSIKDAAKKVKNLLRGKKGKMEEGNDDSELASIVAQIPSDFQG